MNSGKVLRTYSTPTKSLFRRVIARIPAPLIFLAPMLTLVTVFFFVPVILNLILAFTDMDYRLQWSFVGIVSYLKLFRDPLLLKILKNTAAYVLCTLAINAGFGLVLALLTTYFVRSENAGLIFRALWMLPRMTPSVVYALLWLWVLDPTDYGLLNIFLKQFFGLPPQDWILNHPMGVVIIVDGSIGASFGMIIYSAAIKSIPTDYIMAARVDGASDLGIVRRVILPLLKWPIMFVVTWQMLSLLASYEYILLITDGGPFFKSEVWSLHAYHKAFAHMEYGYGAAIAMLLVTAAVILTLILLKVFGFRRLMELAR